MEFDLVGLFGLCLAVHRTTFMVPTSVLFLGGSALDFRTPPLRRTSCSSRCLIWDGVGVYGLLSLAVCGCSYFRLYSASQFLRAFLHLRLLHLI